MVPDDPNAIPAATLAKLAEVERRLACDSATLTDERWQEGAALLAELRRAADDLRKNLERSEAR